MKPDDELCLCFHITRRKVENYLRIERPRAAGQLADCGGAGTGCGWCRPFLRRLFDVHCADPNQDPASAELPATDQYKRGRREHQKKNGP